eukprot:6008814-Pleurochrysis_carterae.AAC.1
MKLASLGRPLVTRFHVQLDNTCAENKNKTVVALLAWLVHQDIFVEASFFLLDEGTQVYRT